MLKKERRMASKVAVDIETEESLKQIIPALRSAQTSGERYKAVEQLHALVKKSDAAKVWKIRLKMEKHLGSPLSDADEKCLIKCLKSKNDKVKAHAHIVYFAFLGKQPNPIQEQKRLENLWVAVNLGNVEAKYMMVDYLYFAEHSLRHKAPMPRIITMLKELIRAEYFKAYGLLAHIYYFDRIKGIEPSTIIGLLERGAMKGDSYAIYLLGRFAAEGDLAPRDMKVAETCFSALKKTDSKYAQTLLRVITKAKKVEERLEAHEARLLEAEVRLDKVGNAAQLSAEQTDEVKRTAALWIESERKRRLAFGQPEAPLPAIMGQAETGERTSLQGAIVSTPNSSLSDSASSDESERSSTPTLRIEQPKLLNSSSKDKKGLTVQALSFKDKLVAGLRSLHLWTGIVGAVCGVALLTLPFISLLPMALVGLGGAVLLGSAFIVTRYFKEGPTRPEAAEAQIAVRDTTSQPSESPGPFTPALEAAQAALVQGQRNAPHIELGEDRPGRPAAPTPSSRSGAH
jgi:hypothetical protein